MKMIWFKHWEETFENVSCDKTTKSRVKLQIEEALFDAEFSAYTKLDD